MAEGKGVGFYVTKRGAEKIATATALGQKVEINIAAFGDGGDFEAVWDYGRFLDKERDLIAYSVVPDKNEHVDIDTGVPIHTVYNAMIKFEPDQVDSVQFNILQGDYRVLDEKLEKHLHSVWCAEDEDIDKLFGYNVDTGEELPDPDNPPSPPGPTDPDDPDDPDGDCNCGCGDLSLADSSDIDALF